MSIPFKRDLKSNIDILIDDSKQNVYEATKWDNIFGKPELFPSKPHKHNISEIVDLPDFSGTITQLNRQINTALSFKVDRNDIKKLAYKNALSFDEVINKPHSYPPSSHSHNISEINGLEKLTNRFNNYVTKQQLLDSLNQKDGDPFVQKLAEAFGDIASGSQIGSCWISVDGTIPVGGLVYDGSTYSISKYKALFEWAQRNQRLIDSSKWTSLSRTNNGNVPYYCKVGVDQFRVPKFNGYPKFVDDAKQSGQYIKEGLPNIKGRLYAQGSAHNNQLGRDGCFDVLNYDNVDGGGSKSSSYENLRIFDASLANKIYGNSEHVTPETNTILVGVYAYSKVTNSGSIDVKQFVNDITTLNAKVNDLQQNKSPRHVVATWNNNKDWYVEYSDGWIEQGGYVYVSMYGTEQVNYFKPLKSNPVSVVLGPEGGRESTCRVNSPKPTSMSITRHYTGDQRGGGGCYWIVRGFVK